ncbi:MAG: hypothetical protein IT577_17585 [Verrucomicrobiae bacterium]|nr:hypothetical protein [Verrucomicrobiae bacterium]
MAGPQGSRGALLKTYSHVRADHEREMVAKVKFGMPASASAPPPAAT